MPPSTLSDFPRITEEAVFSVAKACEPLALRITADPKGLEAVTLAAALRAYADQIEERFGEGNKMGPLKTAVDEVRARILKFFQKRG